MQLPWKRRKRAVRARTWPGSPSLVPEYFGMNAAGGGGNPGGAARGVSDPARRGPGCGEPDAYVQIYGGLGGASHYAVRHGLVCFDSLSFQGLITL